MAVTAMYRRHAARVGVMLRRDLLRSLRLIFLLALVGVVCATLIGIAAQGAGTRNLAISAAVLWAVAGLRGLEYRRVRAVPAWVDALELLGVFAVLAQVVQVEPLISTFFVTVLFRAAVGRLRRMVLLLTGYEAVWLAASVVYPDRIRAIPGAMIALVVISLLVFGTRHLLMRLQEEHQAQSALLGDVLRRLPFPVVVTDEAGQVVLANPAARDLIGWSDTATPSLAALTVSDVEDRSVDLRAAAHSAAATTAGAPDLEVQLTRADGTTRRVKVQPVAMDGFSDNPGAVLALLDVTAQRTYEQHLHQAAYFDMLTGLPNRRMLWERLTVAHATAMPYAVLLIDLNDFKLVNDTLGHKIGDELLTGVAQRLQATMGEGATVARLGGDEFAVMLPRASPVEVETAAEAVRGAFAAPFELSCGPLRGSGTVGLAVAQPGQSPDDVIVTADVAMYLAKPPGKRRTRWQSSARGRCTTDADPPECDAAGHPPDHAEQVFGQDA